MLLRFISKLVSPPEKGTASVAVLIPDGWNDWYKWKTMYSVFLYETNGKRHDLGSVKLAELKSGGSEENPYRPFESEQELEQLPKGFVSLGQDENYYITLKNLPDFEREEFLSAMRDCAFKEFPPNDLRSSEVFQQSVTRHVNWSTINGRYRRLALGNAELTKYKFVYNLPVSSSGKKTIPLEFKVLPDSKPPTNVHVLIGRNAVGKTRALNLMAHALTAPRESSKFGSFEFSETSEDDFTFDDIIDSTNFSSVVSVSFSAFDKFWPISSVRKGVTYHYVGLKRSPEEKFDIDETPSLFETAQMEQKTFEELGGEFVRSAKECRIGRRQKNWRKALETLESDPLYQELEIKELSNKKGKTGISDKDFFLKLSSGHGIVLLIVTRLVELVEEQSLVLVDEPETHLHPPLLSAFVRTISAHMIDTNGVAILATHSPVVLQEAPKKCCYKLSRHGQNVQATRPEIETFAENVGTLTREVFSLEVTKSGFHQLLEKEAQDEPAQFEWILNEYEDQIGSEGQALLRSLIRQNKSEN